jgi:predicted choloylglycine hydrolase
MRPGNEPSSSSEPRPSAPRSSAPGAAFELRFQALSEPQPGPAWQARFAELWPVYRRWFLQEGDAPRPTYLACVRALRQHMPELMPTWEALTDLAGGGDAAARFLSLWCPPPYLTGCSQAVWTHRGGPALVRNYDYSPDLCDGLLLCSAWTGRQPVMAMTDCLWGVLDGMNGAGVAVALAFGGRRAVGRGFGIPLVLRYVLELADDTDTAVEILRRVPIHMAYNVTVVDAGGRFATLFLGPDEPARVTPAATCANHQEEVAWPEHARFTETLERHEHMERLLGSPRQTLERLARSFLEPPLYRTSYDRAWGTLYTAVYDCAADSARFLWPDHAWSQRLARFKNEEHTVRYSHGADAAARDDRAAGGPGQGADTAQDHRVTRRKRPG